MAAFARNGDSLYDHATAAVAIAERYNLGFWRAYAEGYQSLALAWLHPNQGGLERLKTAVENRRRIHLHPGYSIFESSLAELLAQHGRRAKPRC